MKFCSWCFKFKKCEPNLNHVLSIDDVNCVSEECSVDKGQNQKQQQQQPQWQLQPQQQFPVFETMAGRLSEKKNEDDAQENNAEVVSLVSFSCFDFFF